MKDLDTNSMERYNAAGNEGDSSNPFKTNMM